MSGVGLIDEHALSAKATVIDLTESTSNYFPFNMYI